MHSKLYDFAHQLAGYDAFSLVLMIVGRHTLLTKPLVLFMRLFELVLFLLLQYKWEFWRTPEIRSGNDR